MVDSRVIRRRPVNSPNASPDHLATPLQRYGAFSLGATLLCVAALAALFGRAAGPEIKPFVPITATIWSLADLLTAFLLLAQFYINRSLFFGILSFAYAYSGLLTWAFVGTFPHLFSNNEVSVASEQVPSFVWYVWHTTFPLLVTGAVLMDARLERVVARESSGPLTICLAILPALAAGITTLLAIMFRSTLPHFIIHGAFQPAYRYVVLPSVAALNGVASLIILRQRYLTPLKLWLGLATFAACIDVLLVEFSGVRYSYVWDIGKLINVVTGSTVLFMILWDVIGMYGRLARVERIDPLTSLGTRHSFEERLRSLFQNGRRATASLGLLIVSVDSFSIYADMHGTTAAEECLRRVARELLDCAPSIDVARYGEEEFVVLLPGTPLVNVRMTAERIRSIVERLQIVRGGTAFGRITASIGIGYAQSIAGIREQMLFDAADRALYDAIARGRNRVMLAELDEESTSDEPVKLISVSVGSSIR